jgi:hypothetical protein
MTLTMGGPPEALPDPVDPGLRTTLAEHIHCGQPMQIVTADVLSITQPLVVLPTEGGRAVAPALTEPGVTTYRCDCGFTFDEPNSAIGG